jgi:hypothetical protein
MSMNLPVRWLTLVAPLAALGVLGRPIAAGDAPAVPDKAPHASKMDLTPENVVKFRELIRPEDNEWRHLRIKWFTDIVAARKKAAQADKPILIFRTGGAGYNDPLGVC